MTACSQVGWEAPDMTIMTILPQFPHLDRNSPSTPLSPACLWRGSRGVWMKQHFEFRGEFATSMVCPRASHFTAWAQFPPLSNEDNRDTYLIELFLGISEVMRIRRLSQSWHRARACHYKLPPSLLFLARDTPLHPHLSPRRRVPVVDILLTI